VRDDEDVKVQGRGKWVGVFSRSVAQGGAESQCGKYGVISSWRCGPTRILGAFGAVYVTLNINAEGFSDKNARDEVVAMKRVRRSLEKGCGVEGRLEDTVYIHPSDSPLTPTPPDLLSPLQCNYQCTLSCPEFELAKRSGRIRQCGKYIKRPSVDRAKNDNNQDVEAEIEVNGFGVSSLSVVLGKRATEGHLEMRRRGCGALVDSISSSPWRSIDERMKNHDSRNRTRTDSGCANTRYVHSFVVLLEGSRQYWHIQCRFPASAFEETTRSGVVAIVAGGASG